MNNPKQVVFKLEETSKTVKGVFVCNPEDFPSNAEVDAYYRERLELGEAYESDSCQTSEQCARAVGSVREVLLRKLAAEYHERVVTFDAMIAPKGEPRSGAERRAMQLHALGVQDQLEKRIPSYERLSFRYYMAEGRR